VKLLTTYFAFLLASEWLKKEGASVYEGDTSRVADSLNSALATCSLSMFFRFIFTTTCSGVAELIVWLGLDSSSRSPADCLISQGLPRYLERDVAEIYCINLAFWALIVLSIEFATGKILLGSLSLRD